MRFNKLKKAFISIGALLFLFSAVFLWYVNDYYHAEAEVSQYLENRETVQVTEIEKGLFFDGIGTESAVIFYPGAKVEYTSYAPLMLELAEGGIDCFMLEMPFNMAFFGMNYAEDIMQGYTYENWYISGHSLGGAMAASYSAEHLNDLKGLILFAAYPTGSLKADDFQVLSIYGEKDGVLNKEKYDEGLQYMPDNFAELCIEGGNHAGFGMYGEQEGDGEADITGDEQREITIEFILTQLLYNTQ